MQESTVDDWTVELLEGIEAYEPGFSSMVEGASDAQIVALAAELRREVPETLTHFLRRMGRSDGGLFYYERAQLDIDSMIDAVSGYREDFPNITFTDCVPFAFGDSYEGWGLHTALGNDPPVVDLFDGRPKPDAPPVAKNLKTLFFAQAFGRKIGWLDDAAYYIVAADAGDALREALTRAGYEKQWFEVARREFYARGTTLATVTRAATGEIHFVVADKLRHGAKILGDELTNGLSARFSQFRPAIRPARGRDDPTVVA